MDKLQRFVPNGCHQTAIEERDGGQPWLVGYGAVYFREGDNGTEYNLRQDVVERMLPGAFSRSIESGRDIISTYNHNYDTILGRRSNNTLRLTVDHIGLRYEVPVNIEDSDHQRVFAKIKRGDVAGSSFIFTIPNGGQKWSKRADGVWQRDISQVDVYELGPVTEPAYKATSAGLRSTSDPAEELAFLEQEAIKMRARMVETRLRVLEVGCLVLTAKHPDDQRLR